MPGKRAISYVKAATHRPRPVACGNRNMVVQCFHWSANVSLLSLAMPVLYQSCLCGNDEVALQALFRSTQNPILFALNRLQRRPYSRSMRTDQFIAHYLLRIFLFFLHRSPSSAPNYYPVVLCEQCGSPNLCV